MHRPSSPRGLAVLVLAALCLLSLGEAGRLPDLAADSTLAHARSLKKKEPQPDQTVRLLGDGANPFRGRLEVFVKGAWGTVSTESLTAGAVEVLCRQLGYTPELTGRTCAPKFIVWDQYNTVDASVPVYLDDLQCVGGEAQFEDCKYKWKSKYSHLTDAGLQCCDWADPTVRLLDGEQQAAGRLEVQLPDGTWGSVCNDGSFDVVDAGVVCKQLGIYDASPKVYTWAPVTSDAGQPAPVAWGSVTCTGKETALQQCAKSGVSTCSGGLVGVACSAQSVSATVRLVGGTTKRGRLEIFHNGAWGTVCDDGWGNTDSRVACRQMGFYSGGTFTCCANGGANRGSGIIWLKNVQCSGSETRIESCPPASYGSWGGTGCTHGEDIWVICY